MNIAVWYHCVVSGPRIPSEDNAIGIVAEQMFSLKESGLASAASEIHIGVNGSQSDALLVSCFIPDKSAVHPDPNGQTELSTMSQMQRWLKPGWMVLYHHTKGIQHALNAPFHAWRRKMEQVCVWAWKDCVLSLERGFDTCGAHWFTPDRGALPGQRYWPGNFWWARSDYLLTLPTLPPDRYERRYDAEDWIGKSGRPPRFRDLWRDMPLG